MSAGAGDGNAREFERLEAAVRKSPLDGEAWVYLGCAYRSAGYAELAAFALSRATQLEPKNQWGWHYLSVSQGTLEERDAAIASARKAIEVAPGWATALLNLGRQLLDAGRPQEARVFLADPARRVPCAETAAALGVALFRSHDFAGAAPWLEQSLREEPDEPVLWAYLGVCLDETGRMEAAVWALETSVFGLPDYGWAWGRLGKALRALGRHEEAVRAYEKSVEHGFAPPVVWSDLGHSAAEVKDVERLKRACRELGRLDAEGAKPLRRLLRKLRAEGRASAPPREAHEARAEEGR
jgi:tetratricopeptide (TPR) repeat protein